MTDESLEQQLRAFYRGVDSAAAPVPLRRQIAAIADVEPLPGRRWFNGRSFALLAAAALLTVALVGGAVIGAGLLRLNSIAVPSPTPAASIIASAAPPTSEPSPEPSPSPSTSEPSPSASPQPSATFSSGGNPVIAYVRVVDKPKGVPGDPAALQCFRSETTCPVARVWLIGVDGTGAHELLPDGVNSQTVVGWSPDGHNLLYSESGTLYLIDVNGGEPQQVDTGCTEPCQYETDVSVSADGTHLVSVRIVNDANVVATTDLATGQVFEITSTVANRDDLLPGWSPDGTRIVFWRSGDKDSGGPIAPINSAIFVVDADGQNLRQISPVDLEARSPRWSPDGSRIVFTSTDEQGTDVYTMRPDGSDVRRLTTDGISMEPSWTPDGRVLFTQDSDGFESAVAPAFWIMDTDGANAAELIASDVTQAASGGLWQPAGVSAIVPPPWNPSTGQQVGPPAPTPQPTPTPELAAGFSWTGSALPSQVSFGPDTATLLPSGQVLVTQNCDPVAQLYDPTTGTFNATGTMTAARGSASATLLADGRVLIAGGGDCSDASGILASAELYDPASGTFSATGSMGARRFSHTATLLNDGRVLVAGGHTDQAPSAGVTVVLASYNTGLIAETAAGTTLASAELYDPGTGAFSPTGSMADFRSNFTATLLQDGRVLVAGGGGEGYARASAEMYDPQSGTFSATGSMSKQRWLHTATLLGSGRVLITGGRSPKDSTYASAEVYDPATGSFTVTGQMGASRQQHTATLLQDGRVLITGGYTSDGSDWNVLSSTEIYDPANGQFSSSGSMGDARDSAVAVRLADGRVLIAGGEGIGTESLITLTSAVLYQP